MTARFDEVTEPAIRRLVDAVSAHRKFAGVAPPMFGTWLDLFESTASDLFVPDIAERFVCKARRIAESLKLALFFRPDRSWPEDLRRRPRISSPCT